MPDLRIAAESRANPARAAREKAEAELAELQTRIGPLQKEINQLTRQFWVGKDQVVAQNYDLSASRYRQIEQDEVFYEKPAVTLDRMRALEQAAEAQVKTLEKMIRSAAAAINIMPSTASRNSFFTLPPMRCPIIELP
jgi:type I restriction enzyme M protein